MSRTTFPGYGVDHSELGAPTFIKTIKTISQQVIPTGQSDLEHPSVQTPFQAALGFVGLLKLTTMLLFSLEVSFQNSLLDSSHWSPPPPRICEKENTFTGSKNE